MATNYTLLQAINELWDSIGSGTPELYLDEGEEQSGYPRAILQHGGEVPFNGSWDVKSGTPIMTLATFKIIIITENNSDDAEKISLLVASVFKPDKLKLATSVKARMTRTDREVGKANFRTPANKIAFTVTLSYKVLMSTGY